MIPEGVNISGHMVTQYKLPQLMFTVNNRGSFLKSLPGDAGIFHKWEQVGLLIKKKQQPSRSNINMSMDELGS